MVEEHPCLQGDPMAREGLAPQTDPGVLLRACPVCPLPTPLAWVVGPSLHPWGLLGYPRGPAGAPHHRWHTQLPVMLRAYPTSLGAAGQARPGQVRASRAGDPQPLQLDTLHRPCLPAAAVAHLVTSSWNQAQGPRCHLDVGGGAVGRGSSELPCQGRRPVPQPRALSTLSVTVPLPRSPNGSTFCPSSGLPAWLQGVGPLSFDW